MEYKVDFRYNNDQKKHIISNETALKFKKIEWRTAGVDYSFVYDDDKPYTGFFGDRFILILYLESSPNFSAPNNLVLYNLKKEVVKIISTPKSTNGLKMPITSIGRIKMIDGIKHISVRIDNTYFDGYGNVEIHYLNTNTFEYHPTFIEKHKEYGR